ncbi:PEP-CTERM sorting domain-containing protein [endosymbiont of Ridgeia piscesae]|uniref:PEP-CTERM protein-sorting domain n=1 Tax=endosymbiont of Ridgeia piscesae TaxID=54398 RepID=A0A0T5YX78_9GAMM|nr:PEP-CTERM sorting domain-containing protein [endosymbiont of Ridgeia piscesae]KRT54741.1 PEP-CTERM protein-sorting domain [endosymbiont of Ridgeia piscesae]KRT58227.1 PEP-CTERM protein-sorting domain-containing protein [endosymbiont of Ridgeia piscesae]
MNKAGNQSIWAKSALIMLIVTAASYTPFANATTIELIRDVIDIETKAWFEERGTSTLLAEATSTYHGPAFGPALTQDGNAFRAADAYIEYVPSQYGVSETWDQMAWGELVMFLDPATPDLFYWESTTGGYSSDTSVPVDGWSSIETELSWLFYVSGGDLSLDVETDGVRPTISWQEMMFGVDLYDITIYAPLLVTPELIGAPWYANTAWHFPLQDNHTYLLSSHMYVAVQFQDTDPDPTAYFSFDNAQIAYVPEPSALYLMITGIAGLGFARTRKHQIKK